MSKRSLYINNIGIDDKLLHFYMILDQFIGQVMSAPRAQTYLHCFQFG